MNQPILHTRRDFLRTTLLGGALTWTVPGFLANSFSALHAAAIDSAVQVSTGKDGPILVLLQLAGGNDGLNMVVPYGNDDYYRARPRLGIAADTVLKLNEQIGFNPSLIPLKSIFDAGNLQLIQNVGYPNPNRSHFRSTEIWETASDADRNVKYGWLGRYFDNACQGCDPTVAVNIGSQTPQAFFSHKPMGVSVKNPESYRYAAVGKKAPGDMTDTFYREMNGEESMAASSLVDPAGGSIGAVTGMANSGGSPLEFIERTALDAQVSSDQIIKISRTVQNQATYPATPLANDLKLIARLIAGGMPTKIYYASQGGYDTHNNQRTAHDNLLKNLGESLGAFVADLKAQGNFDRVVIMTFSEFGRRLGENGGSGTDHGTAAPQFMIGGKVKGGILGNAPKLAAADLDKGDIKFEIDFRTVYASVLENWLKTPSAPILGRAFTPAPIFV